MAVTNKYSLYKPTADEVDWGEEFNTNLDTIDTIRDIRSVEEITATTTFNADNEDEMVVIIYPGQIVNVYFPQASTCVEGQRFVVKPYSFGSYVNMRPYSGDNIDGDTSGWRAYINNSRIDAVTDGVDTWWIISVRENLTALG